MENSGWLPIAASTLAPRVDGVVLILLVACGAMLFAVIALVFLFGWRYRKDSPYSRSGSDRQSHALEWAWTGATLVIFLSFFGLGAHAFFEQHSPPADAEEVTAIGKQWMWKFQHRDGTRELNELHLPLGKPIVLTMTSEDVIHSFFVPEFRVKQDVLPDRYVRTWFEATRPGTYHLFCTQFCGTSHAEMRGQIVVLTPVDYQAWLERQNPIPLASRGRARYEKMGCQGCHENTATAPSLAGIYGKHTWLADGGADLVDRGFLREKILNPGAKPLRGYRRVMPTYAGQIDEEGILELIAYIRSLEEVHP